MYIPKVDRNCIWKICYEDFWRLLTSKIYLVIHGETVIVASERVFFFLSYIYSAEAIGDTNSNSQLCEDSRDCDYYLV